MVVLHMNNNACSSDKNVHYIGIFTVLASNSCSGIFEQVKQKDTDDDVMWNPLLGNSAGRALCHYVISAKQEQKGSTNLQKHFTTEMLINDRLPGLKAAFPET